MCSIKLLFRIGLSSVAVIIAAASLASALPAAFSARVIGISDGDTIEVLHDRQPEKIRLWGIDCPEKSQEFGNRARNFTGQRAFRQIVQVYPHGKDVYGRTVAEVILPDGENLNQALLRAGLAWWYRKYSPENINYQNLEREARAQRQGIWSLRTSTAPWEFRRKEKLRGQQLKPLFLLLHQMLRQGARGRAVSS